MKLNRIPFLYMTILGILMGSIAPNGHSHPSRSTCGSQLKYASKAPGQPSMPATYRDSEGILRVSDQAFLYAGQKVNTKKFRAPELIERIKKPGERDAYMVINGFLHEGKYYRAKIPVGSNHIKKVLIQTMPFPVAGVVLAGHIQARFEFHPQHKIELFENQPDANGEYPSAGYVEDNIVSYEAALTPDGSYNFLIASRDANPLVGRQLSAKQKFAEGKDREFVQYNISMTADELGQNIDADDPTRPLDSIEMGQLLGWYLSDSIEKGMKYFYNTIVRNCATSIFDGIDALPRFKRLIEQGVIAPFRTRLGGDPVIGPAQNSLIERFGVNFHRVQNMEDEHKGIYRSYGIPERIVEERPAFAPGGENPMALLITIDGRENLSDEEMKLIDQLVAEMIQDLPETFNVLLSSVSSVSGDFSESPKMISAISSTIKGRISQRLKDLGLELPEKKVQIALRFTPFAGDSPGIVEVAPEAVKNPYRAELPFPLYRLDLNPSNKKQVLRQIHRGITEVDNQVRGDLPAFVKNFTLTIDLWRDDPKISTQALLGLKPQQAHGLDIDNEKVNLGTLEVAGPYDHTPSYWERLKNLIVHIKTGDSKPSPRFVNLLLNHAQSLNETNPIANIRFGVDPEVLRSGRLQIPEPANNRLFCWSGAHPHTPRLLGTFADSALGRSNWFREKISHFLGGKSAMLSITDIDMNLERLEIEAVRVRVGVIGLRCLELDSVNNEVTSQAKDKLEALINSLGPPNTQLN